MRWRITKAGRDFVEEIDGKDRFVGSLVGRLIRSPEFGSWYRILSELKGFGTLGSGIRYLVASTGYTRQSVERLLDDLAMLELVEIGE